MEMKVAKLERYNNLDGLRTLAAIGVICMHVKANLGFDIIGGGISNYVINTLIAQMGIFTRLFFIISGFSMCCGYYEKVKNNRIGMNKFYNRRYEKILPFFTFLVLIDLAVSLVLEGRISLESIAEAFADITLMFGFYTTSGMSVIGVGWTLGVIFGFYILFPFFVYLIWDKKRAWLSLLITSVIYLLCVEYFQTESSLAFRWMCYFVLGGLIYLYRTSINELLKGKSWLGIMLVICGFAVVYIIPFSVIGIAETYIDFFKCMIGFGLMLVGALCTETKLWSNPVSRFVSGVSLEIYIAHMLIYRVLEKIGLTTIAGESVFSYIIVCIGTIGGVVMFATVYQYMEKFIKSKVVKA